MTIEVDIRCHCGRFAGAASGLSPGAGSRVVCYCDDCQLFQHALGQAGRVLDAHGGTDIFQTSPGRIRITAGREQLACLRLTPRGTLRWYAGCCHTPIGNTPATPALTFVGLITDCLAGNGDLDAALGPVQRRVFGRYAIGAPAGLDVDDGASLSVILGFLGRVLRWRLRGDHRRSPFFDAETGRPVVKPRVLSGGELADLRSRQQRFRRN